MPQVSGTVIIAQEGRLQIVDDRGVGHLFILAANAAAQAQQLGPLQASQTKVTITYENAPNVIGMLADRIELADTSASS